MNATLPSKELAELQRRFKDGYTVEPTGSSHFVVLDPDGNRVLRSTGSPLTLTSTPRSGSQAAKHAERELREAGVLRPPAVKKRKVETAEQQERRRYSAEALATRQRRRAEEGKALHDRINPLAEIVGGLDKPGTIADFAHIAAMLAREQGATGTHGGAMTPDLLMASMHRVKNSAYVDPNYQELWMSLCMQLESADSVPVEFFRLVRLARNIPTPDVLTSTQLEMASEDWPFTVVLVGLDLLFVDHDYQRPAYWPFVRKTATAFDETLVGAIDVSDRGGRYAIMDGQLRYEAMRLVGKQTCWAAVYTGLDIPAEARFFLRKNRDRKVIAAYYTFRAKVIAGDETAIAIDRVVRKHGYRTWMTSSSSKSASAGDIPAIAALEEAYGRSSVARPECLSPALAVMKESTFGRRQGNAAALIKGLARLFQENGDVEMERMISVLTDKGAEWLIGAAREEQRSIESTNTLSMARVIVREYNRTLGRERSKRLTSP